MLKNIAKEFDCALQKKSVLYYVIGVLVICVLGNVAVVAFRTIYGNNEGTYGYNILEYATWSFILPYLSCIYIADTVFDNDCPCLYDKDGSADGLSGIKRYLAKVIAALLLALTYVMFCIVVFLGVTLAFQFKDGLMTAEAVRVFAEKLFLAMPLWMAGICIGMMFLSFFPKKSLAYVLYFVCTLLVPQTIIFLAKDPMGLEVCKFLRKGLISYSFSLIPYPSNPDRNIYTIVLMGFVYAVLFTVIGVALSNRKKINSK